MSQSWLGGGCQMYCNDNNQMHCNRTFVILFESMAKSELSDDVELLSGTSGGPVLCFRWPDHGNWP